ncbi:ankyrin repeat and protein kinase domain-containing protein 1 [Megalops cyprinoides]|uniref:ankyrin repeat and protein kinase domain-containing protein 1 n=1 Tax=Megalops cyprinoides TaxID=118141 RepID=UPI001864C4AC|nr:ankyrin repeat and protein kinase domain-containing protein 1 [Megalops cyprinoides]
MDPSASAGLEKFRHFEKGDFEADWVKVAEKSFGRVYKVKLKLWRETCALKRFSGTANYRRVIEEVSKMEKMKFNYILSIYGVCSDPPAVVMEFMSGGSLDTLLCSHALMWPKKFQMIHEVTMGMNFLHSMTPPLLHLNLKPANILLNEHLHVKISDFGLIKWEECANKTEFIEHLTLRGNLSYIPPETFTQCTEPPGTKYDVYSFAIVVWEILTQKKPYPGANMMAVLMRVSSGKRPSVEKVPDDKPPECEEMIELMQRCWQQHSNDRPPFSETIRETEALSEVLKIPDVLQACNEVERSHKLAYATLSRLTRETKAETPPDSGEESSLNHVIGLLSRKDFENFRKAVRREHVSAECGEGYSLLHYAAASGDPESVQSVLGLGAAGDSQNAKGYTALIVAVLRGFYDVCSVLVKGGVDANLADGDRWTPLHFAAQNGDDRIARLLLENGATAGVAERDGWTPLHLAAQNGHEGVMRVLLPRSIAVDDQEKDGRTALHLASSYGHLKIAQLLLNHGADANLTEHAGCHALHLAAEEGHFRLAKLLIEGGAEVNRTDQRSYSALHWAALKGHTSICRLLLNRGAEANGRTQQGWTPLHLAALKGHPNIALLLEEHHGSVNAQGENGWTPLHLACHHSQEEAVSVLLTAGADPCVAEDRGWMPLHLACNSGSFPSVLQLISHGADVNAQNASGATPAHLAALNGSVPIIKALLLNGARKDIPDSRGSTARAVAQKAQKDEVVQLLEADSPS